MDDNEHEYETNLLALTSSLAEHYGATEDGIAEDHTELTDAGHLMTAVFGSMQNRAILNIAEAHRQECDGGCTTCTYIRIGLETGMAALRINMQAELQEIADAEIEPAAWTRAVGRVSMPEQMYWRPDYGLGDDTGPITGPVG